MRKRIILPALLLAVLILMTACAKKDSRERVDPYTDINGYNTNLICGIDMFGRTVEPVTGLRTDRDVGIFYFVWHGESGRNTYNITEMLKNDPETLWDTSVSYASFHYWDEPLFGYYQSNDEWVIGKHCELLSQAGIDFIVFDTTNAVIYEDAVSHVLKVFEEYRLNGVNVPKVAFMTNTRSLETMIRINEAFYEPGLYEELWYRPDGEHPLIIGCCDNWKVGFPEGFTEKFDIVSAQWPTDPYYEYGYPWIEWVYPQPVHDGVISVSVAQHPQLPMSNSWFDRYCNQGRGFNFSTGRNEEDSVLKGTNFQSQWDTVFDLGDEVKTVFVTGWNEWIAQKYDRGDGISMFVDQFNLEFSRDIEFQKNGGYEDAFYLQLIENIRKFKGTNDTAIASNPRKTIDIKGDISQWDDVEAVYKPLTQNSVARDSVSVDGQYKYTQSAPDNDIQEIRVAHDKKYIYMMIKTKDAITEYSGQDNWMNVFLSGGSPELQGWESYKYVINRNVNAGTGKSEIILLTPDGSSGKRVGYADFTVSDNVMCLRIPMSTVGIHPDSYLSPTECFYFKVADSVENYTDIMDYYVSGKSAPMGRLSYFYPL